MDVAAADATALQYGDKSNLLFRNLAQRRATAGGTPESQRRNPLASVFWSYSIPAGKGYFLMKHPNEPAMRMAFTLVTVLAVIFASVMAGWAATDPIPAVPPVERAAPIRIVLRPPVIRHAPVNPGQIQQNATSDIALTQLLAENRCLAEVMYFEARGEGALGERAVAEVILRRLAVGTHGLTICGVVYEGANQTFCQFTFVCDGSLHKPKDAEAWRAAQVLAARLLAGELPGEETDGATYYHSISTHPTWAAKMVRVAQIGSHLFYKPVSPALAPLDVSFRGPLQ